ncbi:MAG: Zn-finger nucleic acid-binding protein [Gammaproteobacteria bacterium]|jgi:Zn-finger nucleic acid-binding protein
MQCPNCNSALESQDHTHNGFVHIQQCPKCGGAWLDHRELENLEAGVWADADALALSVAEALSDFACPKCSARMTAVTLEDQPSLKLERCPGCHGIWLDRGELVALQNVLDEHADGHGETLHDRPENWSRLHWVAHRIITITAADGPSALGAGGWA